ncbi:MAG: M48 family metallopeptidase [Parcubacteria group bacterium]|nr:M48 family metallopeptidase [Parcubacteria group bacterium]
MNLYRHKDANIRKTWLLFAVFFVVIIGIGWAASVFYNDLAILVFAVLLSVGMSIASYWYSDKIVLSMSRAHPVERENASELYNVVENLAITAGLPMPRVFLIDEPSPNAFATGRNPKHAAVAVTTGLLERLDRSELEGVLSHELSHIGNRDMLVSTVAVVLVGFAALIAGWVRYSFFFGGFGGRRREGGGGGVVMLIGLVLAILAPIATMLLQLAISRRREYLADASGVLLTRYPEGLARALEKISTAPKMARVNDATAHLWLSDPKPRRPHITKWFMTHPPIEDRIARLRGMRV